MEGGSSRGEGWLVGFVWGYCRPHLPIILTSATLMLLTSGVSAALPMMARELATYDGTPQGTEEGVGSEGITLSTFTERLGELSERVFGALVTSVLVMVAPADAAATTCASPAADAIFHTGLLCRCAAMAVLIVSYHGMSLMGHLAAYRAGAAARSTLVARSLCEILSTAQPERLAVVDAARLTHVVMSSGKTLCDVLGTLLSSVLFNLFEAVGTLAMLLYISAKLTVTVGALVCGVQLLYLAAGKNHNKHSAHVATQEAGLTAYFTNAVRRSETIFVFECRDFIVRRLDAILGTFTRSTDSLNWSIHGYAALSHGSTSLMLVVVLGLSSHLHRRGELPLSNLALYMLFLRAFVSCLVQLAVDASQMWANLGRLRVLQQTLCWFRTPATGEAQRRSPITAHADGTPPSAALHEDEMRPLTPLISRSDDAASDVRLVDVTFTYPQAPDFLLHSPPDHTHQQQQAHMEVAGGGDPCASVPLSSPTGMSAVNGVRDVTLTARAGAITALYGPSGCGKSTCLRLLAGLVDPHGGHVHTHRRALLLEQEHSLFLGSVAENIALQEVCAPSEEGQETDAALHKRIEAAIAQSQCGAFLANPYTVRVDNVDRPPFSGGQQRRICLARVFASGGKRRAVSAIDTDGADDSGQEGQALRRDCSLVLLDEPTTGLDASTVKQLLCTVQELRDVHGMTVVISTHDERVAAVADHVIHLGQ